MTRPPCVNHRASASSVLRSTCLDRSDRRPMSVARRRRVNQPTASMLVAVSYFQRVESPAAVRNKRPRGRTLDRRPAQSPTAASRLFVLDLVSRLVNRGRAGSPPSSSSSSAIHVASGTPPRWLPREGDGHRFLQILKICRKCVRDAKNAFPFEFSRKLICFYFSQVILFDLAALQLAVLRLLIVDRQRLPFNVNVRLSPMMHETMGGLSKSEQKAEARHFSHLLLWKILFLKYLLVNICFFL